MLAVIGALQRCYGALQVNIGLGLDLLLSSICELLREHTTPVWLTVQMQHYSNEQADSFFVKDDEDNQRNNYRSITNEVGFMIHTYLGRDYLNIRFDDIVFIAEAGLYMRINKNRRLS